MAPRRASSAKTPIPAYYLYSQTFEVEGQTYTRKGFLARVRLEPFGSGNIYPHEQTLSGPKADRLALFNATKYNLSPIFGLYPDPENEVIRIAEAGSATGRRRRRPTTSASSTGSGRSTTRPHHRAPGTDGPRPVFIADGHHRYETGLKFRDDLEARGEL